MKSRADLFSDEQGGFVDKLALDTALLEKLGGGRVPERGRGLEHGATGRPDAVSYHGEDSVVYRIQHEPDAVYTEQEQQRMDELQGESMTRTRPPAMKQTRWSQRWRPSNARHSSGHGRRKCAHGPV